MSMNVEVKREVLVPAPAQHISPWALNPSYTSQRGLGMVMTVVHNNSHGTGSANWRQWTNTIQRTVSEDNGATWTPYGPAIENDSHQSGKYTRTWHHFLDPENGLLLSIFQRSRRGTADGPKITSLHCQISTDAAKTWDEPKQIVHPSAECDAIHWMPGVTSGKLNVGVDQGPFAKLGDGTVVFGFTLQSSDMPMGVAFLRGRWSEDQTGLAWDMGGVIRVPAAVSESGVCEPDILHLGGQRLLTTMRCQGIKSKGVPSTRQYALSEDGGQTWSAPQALQYDDGSTVCVPASLAAFEREPQTGKAYWFANILDKPVTGQIPRYPLAIAELDTDRICLLRDSVTVIQDLPDGAPEANEDAHELGRRYSNFGHYVDRATGEFVLMMAEEPKISWDDHTSDCIRFRVRIE